MRLKFLRFLRLCLPLILLAVYHHPAFGGIRPSFALDYCAWHATDVVLVEVTPKDGVFLVVESWTGELQPGDRRILPELKPTAGAMPISLNPKRTDFFAPDESGISEQIPRQHAGSRMVLFLKREKGTEASPTPADTESGEKWRPADFSNEIKTSVVWTDSGYLYGFPQVMNPGPSVLTRLDTSLQEMKDRVMEINRIHQELVKVVSIGKSGARAQGLSPMYVQKCMKPSDSL